MKMLLVLVTFIATSQAFALQDCAPMAMAAAKAVAKINKDVRPMIKAKSISNEAAKQVVEVTFSQKDGSAYLGYTIVVERNPTPIAAKQLCSRVISLEMTSEE